MDNVHFGVVPDLNLEKEGFCIAHSLNGAYMIIGTRGEVIVYENHGEKTPFYRETKRLKGHVGDVNSCSFCMDGKYFITGGEDRTVRIWDLEIGACVQVL